MTGPTGNGRAPGVGDERETSPAGALVPYLRAIRAHLLLVTAVAAVTVAAAAAWLAQREDRYEAEAKVLVSPLPDDDPSFVGLPLVRAVGSDSTRPVRTVATQLRSPVADRRTARRLGIGVPEVERSVEIEPEEDSNLVDVRAESPEAEQAAALANTYAEAALDARRSELLPTIRGLKLRLRRELKQLPDQGSPSAQLLRLRLSSLRSIQNGRDPTVSISRAATVPEAPLGATPLQVLLLAAFGGIALGVTVALLTEILAPRRITDETDLLRLYPLPVLARLPALGGRRAAERAGEATRERFRGLRMQLATGRRGDGRPDDGGGTLVAIASPTRGDGRTSTALGLAAACSRSGQSAILVDLDLRNPELSSRLGIEDEDGFAAIRSGEPDAGPRLVAVPDAPGVEALVGPPVDDAREVERVLAAMPATLARLRREADWVIVDTPPLADATIGFPVLDAASDPIIVVRAGHTREEDLAELRNLVAMRGVLPDGYVLIGSRGPVAGLGRRRGRRRRRRREPVASPLG